MIIVILILYIMCRAKPYEKPIRCSYWNINGHNSRVIGNKLEDPQFVDIVSGSDILGLAETHANAEIFMKGFILIKQKMREKNTKGPKIGGGSYFCKGGIGAPCTSNT